MPRSFRLTILSLIVIIYLVHPQMVPVPESEPDAFSNPENGPDPFTLPQFKKYVDPLVVRLDHESLNEIMINFPHLVILFGEKQAENRDSVNSGFEKLAKNIKKTRKIIFGVLDVADKGEEAIKKFKLQGLPSVGFVDKTKKYIFDGNVGNLTEIKGWIEDFVRREIIELRNKEDFTKFYEKSNKIRLLAVYSETMKKEIKVLEDLLKNDLLTDSGPFLLARTSDQSIVPVPSTVELPSLILYTSFSFQKYDGDYTDPQSIIDFCRLNSLPLVSEFNEETSFRIFAGPVDVQVVMILGRARNSLQEIEEFGKAAKFNKEEELFYERAIFTLMYLEEDHNDLLEFFGIEISKMGKNEIENFEPRIFLTKIDNQLQRMDKYLYEKDEIAADFIHDFLQEFRRKQLKRYLKSDPEVDNQGRWPLVLVGSQFEKDVIRSRDHYVVLFCEEKEKKYCPAAKLFFEKIAERVPEDKRSLVKFAEIDVGRNEANGLEIFNIPHFSIYLRGEKKRPKNFVDQLELVKVWKFISTYLQDKVEIPGFSEDEVQTISLELLDQDERMKLKELTEKNKRPKVLVEGIEEEEVKRGEKSEL